MRLRRPYINSGARSSCSSSYSYSWSSFRRCCSRFAPSPPLFFLEEQTAHDPDVAGGDSPDQHRSGPAESAVSGLEEPTLTRPATVTLTLLLPVQSIQAT